MIWCVSEFGREFGYVGMLVTYLDLVVELFGQGVGAGRLLVMVVYVGAGGKI